MGEELAAASSQSLHKLLLHSSQGSQQDEATSTILESNHGDRDSEKAEDN